jgi:hypothetical protein
MSPEYLAGFFDGEGCIDTQYMYPRGYTDRFYVRPRVRVSQAISGRVVIDALSAQFGGHVSERKAQNHRQQESVSWEFLDKPGVLRMLKLMLPHLVIKKEQAKLVVWWLENASGRYGGRGHRPNIQAARKLFSDELKAMKLDPQRLSERAEQAIAALMR